MDKIKVEIEISTYKDMVPGAKHYWVSIREIKRGEGMGFDNSDFKYKPHAKKWGEMILSEYFDPRVHEFVWEDITEDLEDYILKTPGRY